ncbi:hypothetical protein FACS189425_06170 [Clostridia bacterium]|nr:hypothetical protein FACS189425_06170 [Clostridia bacterium]
MIEKRDSEWYINKNAELAVGEERDTFLLAAAGEFGAVSKARLGELRHNFRRLYREIALDKGQLDGTSDNIRNAEANYREVKGYVVSAFGTEDEAKMDRIQNANTAERKAVFEIIVKLSVKYYGQECTDDVLSPIAEREQRVKRLEERVEKHPDKTRHRYFEMCADLVNGRHDYQNWLFGVHKGLLEKLMEDKHVSHKEFLEYMGTLRKTMNMLHVEHSRVALNYLARDIEATRFHNEVGLIEDEGELAKLRAELEKALKPVIEGGFVKKPVQIPRKTAEVKPQTRDEKRQAYEAAELARIRAGRRKYL